MVADGPVVRSSWTSALTRPRRGPYRRSCPKGPSGPGHWRSHQRCLALPVASGASRSGVVRSHHRTDVGRPGGCDRHPGVGTPLGRAKDSPARSCRAFSLPADLARDPVAVAAPPQAADRRLGPCPTRTRRTRSARSTSRPGSTRSRRPSGPGAISCPRSGSCSARGSAAWPTSSTDPVAIPFADLPGWPAATAPGHVGRLLLGRLDGVPVAMLQGRLHVYEGNDPGPRHPAGAAHGPARRADRRPHERRRRRRPGLRPGHADDHRRPPQPDRPDAAARAERRRDRSALHGPDRRLEPAPARAPARGVRRPRASRSARASTSACSVRRYETPAEVRMLRALGGDAVGMSTVLEAIAARWAGHRGVRRIAGHQRRGGLLRRAADPRGGAGGRRRGGPAARRVIRRFVRGPATRRGPEPASRPSGRPARGRRPWPPSPSPPRRRGRCPCAAGSGSARRGCPSRRSSRAATHLGARNEPRNGDTWKISWRISWNSRRISHWAIVHRRSPLMWMSARRLAVMTRFVRVALGKTNRASSPGIPAATRSPYSSSEPSIWSS